MGTSVDLAFEDMRSLERWAGRAFYYRGVGDYVAAKERPKGVHAIIENGVPIDVYEDLVAGTPLVVFLNGAARRGPDIKLPIFSGFGVVPEGNLSRVCLSDPVLYEDEALTLGWYAGSTRVNAQAILPVILNSIIERAQPSRVIFVGGSGGGFACLFYARQIKDAVTVVWNPQTEITHYVAESVAAYARVAFGLDDYTQLRSLIGTSVTNLYAQGYNNRVLYLQNTTDWHVKRHLVPFLSAQGYVVPEVIESKAYNGSFYLHMGNWGDGHQQPPQSFLKTVLAKLMDGEHGVAELFRPDIMPAILSAGDAASL
jgi:hypothetical protein